MKSTTITIDYLNLEELKESFAMLFKPLALEINICNEMSI